MQQYFKSAIIVLSAVYSGATYAQAFSTIEVGEAVIPAYSVPSVTSLTPFTQINFAAPFAVGVTPNVFTVTPEFGAGADDDPCLIRIRNIDNEGFEATCLEPRNEDRSSPGTTFEYIAIVNGTTVVPTTSGGTVTFESQCPFVNRQSFGPNCGNCTTTSGPATGFQNVNFSNSFSAAPALLTQMVSVNNTLSGSATTPGGEPEFVVPGVRNLDANRFQVTIDRLEAGNGNISNGESICYLAVERQGCQTLDLSGISGSVSSVNFQAVNGSNIDGHDNGASSGEGANFASGCFSSTPVAVAHQITRNGNNGGIMRRVSANASEIILTVDEDRVSDTERFHVDELASVFAFGQTFTTPVTLTHMHIDQLDRSVLLKWQTAAESFHLGFNIWGETNTGWEQLNRKLIPGKGLNSDRVIDYQSRIRLTRQQANQISRYGLSSVDAGGFEEFYGPFEVGKDYGEGANQDPIDWTSTRREYENRMRAKGYINTNGRWRKVSAAKRERILHRQTKKLNRSVELSFDAYGMHKVSMSQILNEQTRWRGKPIDRFAVTLNGNGVARRILSVDSRLSDDDVLILNVAEPNGRDALYLNHYRYRVKLDERNAVIAPHISEQPDASAFLSRQGYVKQTLTRDQQYSAALVADDPWYDSQLLTTGGAVSKSFAFTPVSVMDEAPAILDVALFGSIDLPGDTPDHHIQVVVNGVVVDDARFDGLTYYEKEITLPVGLLNGKNDKIDIVLPGDTGLFADLVLIDSISLSYPTQLREKAIESFSVRDSSEPSDVDGFTVEIADQAQMMVFAQLASGAFATLATQYQDRELKFNKWAFSGNNAASSDVTYTVADVDRLPGPMEVRRVDTDLQHQVDSDLLIVAHPQFIGQTLDAFVAHKAEQSWKPVVLDWFDLVQTYGYGNDTPEALNNFLAQASAHSPVSNVLIVGGHTFDYRDVLGANAVNFIPTHYRRVGIFEFAPTDNVYADIDGDQRPDLALGRWPVRSAEDLAAIVNKSIVWQRKRENNGMQNALLIAQANDGRNLNFENALDGRVAPMLSALQTFDAPEKVYLNQLVADSADAPIERARKAISESINQGVDLVSFSGHASNAGWGFQGIVNTDLIKNLTNQSKPTIVMPLACYTTNYQSLSVNTLAHQWLFAGEQGAVAVHGAAMLGEYRENGIFAERVLQQSLQAKTLGEAIMRAKREMTSANEMLNNWTLLGDPTLGIH